MDAQYNLGVMYAKGRGVERNEAKAVELLTLAADKGDANAQLNLGIMYAKGRGVDKDETKAFQLCEKAAEQGHASAQYNLGAMYATGRGVKKDLERAVHLYQQVSGCWSLTDKTNFLFDFCRTPAPAGVIFLTICIILLQSLLLSSAQAATQGVVQAQYSLGLMYQYGKSVQQSADTAIDLFSRAARQGHAKAKQHLDQLQGNPGEE